MNKGFIGVFDSGYGGLSTLEVLLNEFTEENFMYFGDSKNAPYGIKTDDEIFELCSNITKEFIKKGAHSIVIACNTATAASIDRLKKEYIINIYGIQPPLMDIVKNNSMSTIVFATQSTLNSQNYLKLKKEVLVSKDIEIIDIPMPEFVILVENGVVAYKDVEKILDKKLTQTQIMNVDTIVLGCTHFLFLKKYIKKYFDKRDVHVRFLDGNENLVSEIKSDYKKDRNNGIELSDNLKNIHKKSIKKYKHNYKNLVCIDNSKPEYIDKMYSLIKKEEFPFYKIENVNNSIYNYMEENDISDFHKELINLRYFNSEKKIDFRLLSKKYSRPIVYIKDELEKLEKGIYKYMSKEL